MEMMMKIMVMIMMQMMQMLLKQGKKYLQKEM